MLVYTEAYERALQEYIEEGINWGAHKNDVINCDRGNVEQLVADTFFAGCVFVMEMFNIESLNLPSHNK